MAAPAETARRAVRAIVAEDDPFLRMDLEDLLTELSVDVVGTTARGAAVVAMVDELRPDVVLLDIGLADGMDGLAAAAAIRHRHDVAIVFVSGNDNAQTRARIAQLGRARFIAKPATSTALRKALPRVKGRPAPRPRRTP